MSISNQITQQAGKLTTNIVPSSTLQVSDLDGQLVVDSRLIAKELGINHKSTMQLIRANIEDLQEFGVVPFQMAKPLEGSTGGRPETFCYLSSKLKSNAVLGKSLSQ